MEYYKHRISDIEKSDCLRQISDIEYKEGKYIFINNKKCLNLSSNDYLGLSTNKDLVSEFFKSSKDDKEFLFSSASSRLLTGTSAVYSKLEKNLAELFKKERCLLFNSGFQCNLGVISALVEKGDVIFSDKLNHSSIISGMRLSQADFHRYKHLDYDHLESLLKKHRQNYRQALIVSESVFSMDGDIAGIKKLVELKKKYDCILMIDEAHAFGIFGENLCGVCEKENISDEVDVITATLGKSFASVGAFCVADKTIVDYLVNKASSFIFSTAMAPVNVMWSNWLIENKYEILKSKRDKLTSLFNEVHGYLNDGGKSQIIPVILGDNKTAVKITDMLQEEGYFVLPIRPPTVPQNTSRVRLSLIADMSFAEVKNVLDVIKANI
jgi:8-amino-7-oxononanoate synthase